MTIVFFSYFSLDALLVLLGILIAFGFGFAFALGAWLWSHAVAVGVVLLILHIVLAFMIVSNGFFEYSVVGAICALIQEIFPPVIVISAYRAAIESGKSFGFGMFVNWFLVFACLNGTMLITLKAFETDRGRSYLRLLGFTVLNVFASLMLTGMIRSAGF